LWIVGGLAKDVSAFGKDLLSVISADVLGELFSFLFEVFALVLVFVEHILIPSFLM
jgi:hypothetical protein